jgi:predicted transcriptional regulator YdeE
VTVAGLGLDCPGYDGSGIGLLWGRSFARCGELPQRGRCLGAGLPRRDGYYYIAGWEVPGETALPAGMESTVVPAANYFKIRFCNTASLINKAYNTIFSEILPGASLQPVYGPVCIEDYPADGYDPATDTLKCDIYIQLSGPSTYEPPAASGS